MRIIALTGGIASGKTQVCQFFSEIGAEVLYADDMAHQVYRVGTPIYRAIQERYGSGVLQSDGQIHREKLAEILFNSPDEKQWLESHIHPATRQEIETEIKKRAKKNPPLILVEAALHVETGYYQAFEGLIVVHVSPQVQLDRLMERDKITRDQAKTRIQAQIPLEEKVKKADWVIDNSGSLTDTQKQVAKLYQDLTQDN